MAERLLGPVVLVASFFCMLTLLAVLIAPVIIENQRPYAASMLPPNLTDILLEDFLDDWPPSPYVVEADDYVDAWSPNSDPTVTFDPGGGEEHPLKCWNVRDDDWQPSNPDYLVFQQIYGWFGMKEVHTSVPYGLIANEYNEDANYSRVTIDLRYNFELFFWAAENTSFVEQLYANTYNLTVAVGMNDTLDSLSPWGMVGKVMTGRLPGTHWVINAMLMVPIYMMLFYIAFAIIRSCIPFLGG